MKHIYLKRCRANYPHDFPDYPCKKCNGIILENVWEKVVYKIKKLLK